MQGGGFVPLIINGFDISVYFDEGITLSLLSKLSFSAGGQC